MGLRKVYTKKGDQGYTFDFLGKRIAKDHQQIVIAGKMDAVQAAIDLAVLRVSDRERKMLETVQRKLWQTAGELANCTNDCITDPVTEQDLAELEAFIDSLGEPPKKFVRFNTGDAIVMNECRVRCRELETFLVKILRKKQIRPVAYQYLNRISSLFFMLAYAKGKKEY